MSYGRLKNSILKKGLSDLKREGALYFIIKIGRFFQHKYLKKKARAIVTKLSLKPKDSFIFNNQALFYLLHTYNLSWINERTIEIPIVLNEIKKANTDKILEAGAVLKHYIPAQWPIVDKFEGGNGIINRDLADYIPKRKYELIISVSTLEHVGFDDENNPEKIISVIENMKRWVTKHGKIIATMPLGYNKYMDNLIFNNKLGFNKYYFMKRVSRKNKWIQVKMEKVKEAKYNYPYNNANAVVIAIWEN